MNLMISEHPIHWHYKSINAKTKSSHAKKSSKPKKPSAKPNQPYKLNSEKKFIVSFEKIKEKKI